LSFEPTLSDALLFVPGVFFALFILVIFWLILFAGILVCALRFEWRRTVTGTIALAFSVLLVVSGQLAADYFHLIVMYPHYKAVIGAQAGPVYFDWGSFEWGWAPEMENRRVLIYDASGATVTKAETGIRGDNQTTYLMCHFFLNEDISPP
jgi:glucan phosphoethanolaminetransferase (alkaline phosphatase superfamily)